MYKYVSILIAFFSLLSSYASHPILVRYSISTGSITEVFVSNEVGIFNFSQDGILKYVILGSYNNVEQLKTFAQECNRTNLNYLDQDQLRIYYQEARAFDYYDKFTHSRKNGNLFTLDNIVFDYFDFNHHSHKNGYLSKINGTTIDYYDSNIESLKNGKLSTIGPLRIDYYEKATDNHKNGKLSRIGGSNITYYDKVTASYKNGKIKSIGGFFFDYYDKNGNSFKNGKLKHINGTDSEITLIQVP